MDSKAACAQTCRYSALAQTHDFQTVLKEHILTLKASGGDIEWTAAQHARRPAGTAPAW